MWLPALQWRYNEHDGVSNHQRLDCLPNRLLKRRSNETSKLRVTGLCEGNLPLTVEFPAQRVTRKMFPFDDVIMWILGSEPIPPAPLIFQVCNLLKPWLHKECRVCIWLSSTQLICRDTGGIWMWLTGTSWKSEMAPTDKLTNEASPRILLPVALERLCLHYHIHITYNYDEWSIIARRKKTSK